MRTVIASFMAAAPATLALAALGLAGTLASMTSENWTSAARAAIGA